MSVFPDDAVDDTVVYPAMVKILACVEKELAARKLPRPGRIGLYPGGEAPLDECGGHQNCGMLWVRLVTAYDSANPPQPSATASRCGTLTVPQLEVGIARCAPMPDNNGNPPSVDELWAATRLQMADMAAIKRAIVCCYPDDDDDEHAVMLGTYTPLPPSGDCVGGSWTVTIW